MLLTQAKATKRTGATLVETAFVIVIFTMFLFGIIEFGRFIFVRQVVINAAREGVRYAVVHSDEDTLEADTQAVVQQRMAGVDGMLGNYSVALYHSDAKGNNIGPASEAEIGDFVTVEISATYDPVLPTFLFMGSNIPIQARSVMQSEAN